MDILTLIDLTNPLPMEGLVGDMFHVYLHFNNIM